MAVRLGWFVLCACAFGQQSANKPYPWKAQVGIVSGGPERPLCLAIQNSLLRPGDVISVVQMDSPQTVVTAKVRRSMLPGLRPQGCFPSDALDNDLPHYELAIVKGTISAFTIALGVMGAAAKLTQAHGIVSGDLDGDGRPEYFRSCTSTEGVHLSVWSGRPRHGQCRWSAYYHLNYDTEPTCTQQDCFGN